MLRRQTTSDTMKKAQNDDNNIESNLRAMMGKLQFEIKGNFE